MSTLVLALLVAAAAPKPAAAPGPDAPPGHGLGIVRDDRLVANCATCPNGSLACFLELGTAGHRADYAPTGSYQNPHPYCLANPPAGACSGHSTPCGSFSLHTPAEMNRVRSLVIDAAAGSEVAALALVREFGVLVEAVQERGSLIVRSCGGGILGFFPVAPRIIRLAVG